MTADQLVAAALAQFDTDSSTALGWLNGRYKRMVAQADWRGAEVTVGTTVSGQGRYPLDDVIVDMRRIRVGTTLYERVGREDIWTLQDPDSGAQLVGTGGVFSESFDSAGTPQVELYPAPSEDGDTITGLVTVEPDDLALNSGQSPLIPSDLHVYLLDGMRADGYETIDERFDLAQLHEQRFEAGIGILAGRRKMRVGNGPVRAKLYGRDFV